MRRRGLRCPRGTSRGARRYDARVSSHPPAPAADGPRVPRRGLGCRELRSRASRVAWVVASAVGFVGLATSAAPARANPPWVAAEHPSSASPTSSRPAQDTPALTLAPPAGEVTAGAVIGVGVFFHNAGEMPRRVVPPERLALRLVTPRSTLETELALATPPAVAFELAPGASRRVSYALALPDTLAGPVALELARPGSASALIQVRRAPSAADPAIADDVTPTASAAETEPARTLPLAPPIPIAEHVIQRFSAHEPNYFLGGDRPTARFQFSFKYQVFDPESEFASEHPWIASMRVGYTQTSLWDVAGTSKPFTDSSYKPEIFWSRDRLDSVRIPGVTQFGLEAGLQHESNGRDGDESRSLNVLYARPVFVLGDPERFHWRVMPKFVAYVFDQSDNPDVERYRGWCDLRVAAGRRDALEVAAQVRVGSGFDRGSVQLDATYPLGSVSDAYLQLQYVTGYGESLLNYDERSESLRFGIALSR